MHRHHAYAVRAFLDDWRVRRVAGCGRLAQDLHEPAERQAVVPLVLARELGDVEHVGQHLFAAAAQREAHVRTRGGEQAGHGVGRGPAVAGPVQTAQERQGVADWCQRLGQLGRHLERVKAAGEPMAEVEERFVAHGEQGAAQRGEDRQLVVGPFNGGQRRSQRLDLFAIVKGASAHEHVRNAPGLEGIEVGSRDVAAVGHEPPEQDADVTRLYRTRGAVASGDGPSTVVHEPVHERADGAGERRLDGGLRDAPHPVGAWDGQGDKRRLTWQRVAGRREGDVPGLLDVGVLVHGDAEGQVHGALKVRRRAEARRELHPATALTQDLRHHLLVHADVGPPEPVNRLLRVTHQEQAPGARTDARPVALVRIVRRQQQEELGLQRVGILELVHEEAGEAHLEVAPCRGVISDQVAGADQEIEEVERSRRAP